METVSLKKEITFFFFFLFLANHFKFVIFDLFHTRITQVNTTMGRDRKIHHAKNQSECRVRYHALLEKIKFIVLQF